METGRTGSQCRKSRNLEHLVKLSFNPLPGVGQEKGIAESDEEVEDAQLIQLSTKLVLLALKKEAQNEKSAAQTSLQLYFQLVSTVLGPQVPKTQICLCRYSLAQILSS